MTRLGQGFSALVLQESSGRLKILMGVMSRCSNLSGWGLTIDLKTP